MGWETVQFCLFRYLSALRDSAIVLFYVEFLRRPRAAPRIFNMELENDLGPVLGCPWAGLGGS